MPQVPPEANSVRKTHTVMMSVVPRREHPPPCPKRAAQQSQRGGGWSRGWNADTRGGTQRNSTLLHKVRAPRHHVFLSTTPHCGEATLQPSWDKAFRVVLAQTQPRQRPRAPCWGMSASQGSGQGVGHQPSTNVYQQL